MFRQIDLRFDWRSMGISAYLPVLVICFLIFITAINRGSYPEILPAIEMLLPIMGSWWTIYLLHDLLSEEGNEVHFTYPVRRWQFGIVRVLLFYGLFVVLMLLMFLVIGIWTGYEALSSLALQYGTQAFFYSGLGFLAMVITLNTGWSLVIVTGYLSLQLLSQVQGNDIPILDIYLHNTRPIPLESLLPHVYKTGILGSVLFLNAQYFLSTTNRYK